MKYLNTRKFLFILLLAFAFFSSRAQLYKSGPQILSFHSDVDDTEQPYACYLPPKYKPGKAYPMVVMLHGAGSNHRLELRRVFGKSNAQGENDVEASLYFPEWKDVEYIVVVPYARGTMGYQGIAEKDVWDMISDVNSRFNIDSDRCYLTGLSMGGGGTLWIGLTRPDFWAAIAPVCPAPPPGTELYAENSFNYPVHFFQGGADPVVKPEGTRRWVENLKANGTKVVYEEYPGVLHDSWVNAYKDEFIFSWFAGFKRNRFPEKVKFSTAKLTYNKAYWVTLEDFVSGEPAKIEATFTGKNRLEIKTSGLKAFSLSPEGHPSFSPREVLQVNIDGQSLKMTWTSNQVFVLTENDWKTIAREEEQGVKKGGLEGPMSDITSGRHIYVYGTGGNPSGEELSQRREMAQKAAEWSFYRGDFLGRVMVFPRVLSDREVRPNDIERSHLVLFGTPQTNILISRFADKLPMQLKDGRQDTHGLSYIYPAGDKYVLICSGLPWWDLKVPDTNPFAMLSAPGPAGELASHGDWLLFEKAGNNIISQGRFNRNWKLNSDDAGKLKQTGLVEMK